jgi:hypothetical protein
MSFSAERLNAECACVSLDREALTREFARLVGDPEFARRLAGTHPTLLSSLPVFLDRAHLGRMAEIVRVIEGVARLPAYQEAALAEAPAIARHPAKALGVLMGYDFHLGAEGPKLIEINTNAGGGLINAVLAKAQRACCLAVETSLLPGDALAADAEAAFLASFFSEWRRERGEVPLHSIVIIDEAPKEQYLYPEFVLFQRLFERAGLRALILAPHEVRHESGRLAAGSEPIDLVYNRLTDFALERPGSAALRSAWLAGDIVLTPHPRAHALFADKRNLVRLSDAALLRRWGVAEEEVHVLQRGIPRTVEVTRDSAPGLWTRRDRHFFKPNGGFASRAAYRGDKLTKRVWEEIVGGGYVAQDLVPPSTRMIDIDGTRRPLKADVRMYTYDGAVQLVAARLYQGQTTNMRTPGGGFAPVLAGTIAEPCTTWSNAGDCSC